MEKNKRRNISIKLTEQLKTETISFKKSNIINSVLISCLITTLLFFVFYDYNMMKNRIETQLPIITNQLDSLSLYLQEKSPELNESLIQYEKEIKSIESRASLVLIYP